MAHQVKLDEATAHLRDLVDTHSFLWFVGGNRNLSPAAREIIENADHQPLLSMASLTGFRLLRRWSSRHQSSAGIRRSTCTRWSVSGRHEDG